MIRLAECTYREAGRLALDERALVILPLGAIEQHGPHLPLLVDWLGAEELARHVAPHLERAGYRVVLAPALPYGASPLAATWPGTVSLSRATLRRVIVEVIRGLARHGFRRFVLANYQADPAHVRAMAEAKRALTRGGRAGTSGRRTRPRGRPLRILFAGFSPEAPSQAVMVDPRVRRLSRSPRPAGEWHAGELETALVLARRPDLVRRVIARRLPPVWVDFQGALRRGARRFEEIAPGGAATSAGPRRRGPSRPGARSRCAGGSWRGRSCASSPASRAGHRPEGGRAGDQGIVPDW